MSGRSTETDAHAAHGDAPEAGDAPEIPGGVMIPQDGYTLDMQTDTAAMIAVGLAIYSNPTAITARKVSDP